MYRLSTKCGPPTTRLSSAAAASPPSPLPGLVDFSYISLFQMGFIKSMPDLPGKIFDSNAVNSSKDARAAGHS